MELALKRMSFNIYTSASKTVYSSTNIIGRGIVWVKGQLLTVTYNSDTMCFVGTFIWGNPQVIYVTEHIYSYCYFRLLQSLSKSPSPHKLSAQTTTLQLSQCLLSMCNNIVKGDNSSYDHQGAAVSTHSCDGYSQAESMAYNVSRTLIHSHHTIHSYLWCVCVSLL